MANDYKEHNDFKLKDFYFLPSIGIELLDNSPEKKAALIKDGKADIWDDTELTRVNLAKFNSHVTLQIKSRSRNRKVHSEERYIRTMFRKCRVEDFEANSFKLKDDEIAAFTNRLCPETGFKDLMTLKNDYGNLFERESLQIEIVRCRDGNNGVEECREKAEVEDLLSAVFFTLYLMDENVEFGNAENLGGNPIRS